MKPLASLIAAPLAACTLAAGCGGSSPPPITIGVISQCAGSLSPLYEPTLAAAELPLLTRGGKLAGKPPIQGVHDAEVGGHPLRVALGCSDGSPEVALRESRRLVEEAGAQIVIGPLAGPEGLALRAYAARQPRVTFVTPSPGSRSITLGKPLLNVYRFASDSAQLVAGLGTYAYRVLGWRKAVILGQPTALDYGEAAGFTAEFCSLGGDVVSRQWAPPQTGAARAAAARLPRRGVDGAAVFSRSGGLDLIRAFAPAGPLRGRIVTDVVLGGTLSGAFGARADGVAWAWPAATEPDTPAWNRYAAAMRKRFPHQARATSPFAIGYFTSMEAVLLALETVRGELLDEQALFRAALAASRFESPLGPVRLDANRQLVATNRIALVDAKAGARAVRTIGEIDQSFGGSFPANGPPPGPDSPACRHGTPPPWAG
jgi:branched-chain amino acid transport system substrate-binding protein